MKIRTPILLGFSYEPANMKSGALVRPPCIKLLVGLLTVHLRADTGIP